MFNDKEYFEVNREERHFGNLLISSLIYNSKYREYFFGLVNKKIGSPDFLRDPFDIYSETAILRDYWNDLGDAQKWTQELFNRRREIIDSCLDCFKIDKSIIDKEEYKEIFWTNKKKLCSPGKWTEKNNGKLKKLKDIQRKYGISESENYLCRIGWAFNAKPDILIISGENCIIIELKLESGIGRTDDGYNQIQTQQDIIDLCKITAPFFSNKTFKRILLTKEASNNDLSWSEALSDLSFFSNDIIKKHFKNIVAPGT